MPTVYIQSSCFLPTPSEGAGAVEYLVSKMADGLARRGWRVTLFALDGSLTSTEYWLATIPAQGDAEQRERRLVGELNNVCSAEPPDVIFDHSLYMLAGMRKDIPYVAMSHGMARLPSWAHNVVFTSRHHGKLHKARDPHALLLGIDLADIPSTGAERSGLFWAGRILPYKRLHLACEIARRAGMPLTAAGPVADREYFDWVSREYRDMLHYVGELPRAEVLNQMARSKLLLFTSDTTEPAGLVMLEARACGLPIIAINDGSAHEYVRGGGWVFPDGDLDGAARMVIDHLAGHFPEQWLSASVEGGCKAVAAHYTIDHMVDRAEEYLRAAIGGARW